jgi:putative pyruvate formate lyase activating enzyme
MDIYQPGYLNLYQNNELQKRAEKLKQQLQSCNICPRDCRVNRLEGQHGFCRAAYLPIVSSYCAHHGEEPPVSGSRGSGTIFFGNCNMRCVYCQNHQISQDWRAQQVKEISISDLAGIMLDLQNKLQCHNINLVTPSHFVPQILLALCEAVPRGLRIPLIYNTSGYDAVGTIRELEGIIDVYLPDIRYADEKCGRELSQAPDYPIKSREAIKEMYRQVGNPEFDTDGIIRKGFIVRHLILPNGLAGSENSLSWLVQELSPDIYVSLMAQYYPAHEAMQNELISRRITAVEYAAVMGLLDKLDIHNGWVQEMEAADNYSPDFSREGHPFETGNPDINIPV